MARERPTDETQQTPLWRGVTVWAGATALTGLGTALGATVVVDSAHVLAPGATIEDALVALAAAATVILCPWLWLVATLTVREALLGRVHPGAGWARRLTLLACGVAITTTALGPAHAAPTDHQEPSRTTPGSLSLTGLPYPDRASGTTYVTDPRTDAPRTTVRAPRTTAPQPEARDSASDVRARPHSGTHVVRPGDTLWHIAGATAADDDLPRAVAELHRANRREIGDDPDLIHPGQVLDVPREGSERP